MSCATYQTARTGLTTQYEVQALTSTQRIRDFLKRDPSPFAGPALRDKLSFICPMDLLLREKPRLHCSLDYRTALADMDLKSLS